MAPFCRWGNWGTERWSDLPKVTKWWVHGRVLRCLFLLWEKETRTAKFLAFCFFHSSLDSPNESASVDLASSVSLGRRDGGTLPSSQVDGFWVPFPSVSPLAPGILFGFAFASYRFGQTLSYNKLQNSTIVLKKESFTYCLIYPVLSICEIYIVLYMEKIKEKLLIRSHANSPLEGTVESWRLSVLNT